MIYNRLLELYKKNRASEKTPLEDFITEILVGVLENDNELLDSFVNNILEIEGTGFSIESQVKYNLDNDINCIIDIVVRNDENICFIENKVHSSEGERQLERYSKVLNEIHSFQGKNMFLRYCTKFYDPKNIDNIDFLQYRWSNVYRFLEEYKSELIYEYLEFLRGEGMAGSGDFNYEDLITLKNIYKTLSKMDECLDEVKVILENTFNSKCENKSERTKQIKESQLYIARIKNLNEYRIEVGAGFDMDDEGEVLSPTIIVYLFLENKSDIACKFKEYHKKYINNKIDIKDYSTDKNLYYVFEVPLINFFNSENQVTDIISWMSDKIIVLRDILNEFYYLN